ncbi:LysR family transcriptional regulator [Marinobacter lipolyticus SM19]|uniref:LysR family transcriptional regulator n=1 Tax=Marinobacter lipolyticus SM19 TaxID=1318628 RepID=R8B536_9GAMM|nr:LysR family transcriptional regulator [Marinobacter lipolyticus]EON93661.1 LysR family transcriptional regulator [Marinobacter lipolyticus SM19]
MITIHQLKVFVAVAECGSTSAAARALHLSQPAISLIVRNLESELGAELFIRNPPRGLAITPFGRGKLEEARTLLSQAEMFGEPQDAGNQLRGQLTLGYFTTLGPFYVPRLIRRLRERMPKVEVQLREGDLGAVGRMLDTGQVELAITYDLGMGDQPRTQLLRKCRFYAALPLEHPLARQESVSLAELAQEPFIQIDLPMSREFLMSPFWHHQLEPRIAYRTTSLEMVRGMVAHGLGVSILITRPASELTYDGERIVCRPISDEMPVQNLVLAQSHHFALTPVAAAVMAEIRDLFSQEDLVP